MPKFRDTAFGLTLALMATPVLAGVTVPAPILGAGLPGLVLLGAAGGGYLLLKWRKNRG